MLMSMGSSVNWTPENVFEMLKALTKALGPKKQKKQSVLFSANDNNEDRKPIVYH